MRKTIRIILLLLVVFCLYLVYNHFTYEFMHIGDMKDGNPVSSPKGDYSAQIYYENYGGAAGGVNVIVNIINHKKDDEEKTIYFSDAKGKAFLNWTAPDILSITNINEYENRSTELVIGKEIYDEHGGACNTYKIKKAFICKDKDSS